MPLNLVRRGGGAFRSVLARPVRVIVPQSNIKRLLFVARRPLPTAVTASFSRSSSLVGDLIRSYATTGRPKGSNTESTANKKPKKATKAVKKPAKSRRELTPEQIEKKEARKKAAERRQLVRSLKETALQPPKPLPTRARAIAVSKVYAEARAATSGPMSEALVKASALVETMSADERQQCENQAEANKIANEAAYEAWIKHYTPNQIREANNARRRLAQLKVTKRASLLKDNRLVKQPTGPYFFFLADKREDGSGIGKSMKMTEETSYFAEEWKNLAPAEKEKYMQLAKADRERYYREHLETYGLPPSVVARSKSQK